MGSIEERDLDSLAFLAATAKKHVSGPQRDRAPAQLLVMVNAPRFEDLEEKPARVIGRAFDKSRFGESDRRRATRSCIEKCFRDQFYGAVGKLGSPNYESQIGNIRELLTR